MRRLFWIAVGIAIAVTILSGCSSSGYKQTIKPEAIQDKSMIDKDMPKAVFAVQTKNTDIKDKIQTMEKNLKAEDSKVLDSKKTAKESSVVESNEKQIASTVVSDTPAARTSTPAKTYVDSNGNIINDRTDTPIEIKSGGTETVSKTGKQTSGTTEKQIRTTKTAETKESKPSESAVNQTDNTKSETRENKNSSPVQNNSVAETSVQEKSEIFVENIEPATEPIIEAEPEYGTAAYCEKYGHCKKNNWTKDREYFYIDEPVYELHTICHACGTWLENMTGEEMCSHLGQCRSACSCEAVQVGTTPVQYFYEYSHDVCIRCKEDFGRNGYCEEHKYLGD